MSATRTNSGISFSFTEEEIEKIKNGTLSDIECIVFELEKLELSSLARHFRRGFPGLSEKLPLHGRHLGGAGGHAGFPEGADSHRARTCH